MIFPLWYENLDIKQLYDDWQTAKKKGLSRETG